MVDYVEEEKLENEFLASVFSICRSVFRFSRHFVKIIARRCRNINIFGGPGISESQASGVDTHAL